MHKDVPTAWYGVWKAEEIVSYYAGRAQSSWKIGQNQQNNSLIVNFVTSCTQQLSFITYTQVREPEVSNLPLLSLVLNK